MYEKFLYPETRHVVLNMEVFIKVSFFFGKMKAKPVGKERERGCEAFPERIDFQVTAEDRE